MAEPGDLGGAVTVGDASDRGQVGAGAQVARPTGDRHRLDLSRGRTAALLEQRLTQGGQALWAECQRLVQPVVEA